MSSLITARRNYVPPSYRRAALADKEANPLNYLANVDVVSLWLNSDASRGGLFNMTKTANPFSKLNAGKTLSGITSALGPVASNLLSNGYSAGTGFNTAMSAIQGINTGNPVFDTIKNVAATAVLTVGNLGWGTKENKENINALDVNKSKATAAGTMLGDASTSDDLIARSGQMTSGLGFKTTDLVKGGWFAKGKARKKGQNMLNQEANALAYQSHGLQTGATNVDKKQDNMVMSNFAAFGGPLVGVDPSTAIGYLLYTDKYVKDNNKSVPNMFAGTSLNLFETGGPKKSKEQKDAEDNIDNLIWYLGQRMKYPYGRKRTEFEKFLNNDLNISERITEPWFGDANTPTIFNSPILSPSPEEKLQNTINNARKLVNSIGTGTRKVVSLGEPYIPHMTFALGGDIQTHGADWDTGVNHVNSGGTHEENPYEGVQMGVDPQNVPNLVEEGEVIYKDYVFSNRLTVPKFDRKDDSREAKSLRRFSGKTFADSAKKIEKRMGADERTDAITKAGLDVELQLLAQILEKERQKQQLQEMQDAIDNMSPEEFAMLQQQMQAQQDEQAYQEAMAQQQLAIPQGMEQMVPQEQLMGAYGGPIYALGGVLNGWEPEELVPANEAVLPNIYATGGSTDDDENPNDYKLRKSLERLYKKNTRKFDYDELNGHAKAAFEADLRKVKENPELLKEDINKELNISGYKGNKSKMDFNLYATNQARDRYLGSPLTLNDNGKLAIRYNDEGTIPQALSFLQNGLTYDGKKWKDALGNIVENPYSKEYGFTDVNRDWSKYGYLNPKDNTWTSVEYNPPTEASGNTDYRYTPWNLWFTLSGMNADEYEAQDAYLNNYLDFLDDIYNKESPNHQAALRRLYEMGEATKSNAPGELKGKNRYFDTDKEGFDTNNLSLDNLRTVDGYNTIGDRNITGFSVYNKAASDKEGVSNKLYYTNKNGLVISPTTFLELDEKEKKDWTPLDHKGLTRQDVLSHLKAVRNIDEDTEPDNLLFKSMFDNNPAQSYLMAPNGTRRYALVDGLGNYIKDGDKIRYLDYNPDATYNFYKKDGTNVTPIESLMIDGVNVDTIGVLGGTVDNHIGVRRNPDGTWQSYRLTPEQAAKLKQREIASTDERYGTLPQFEEVVGGYTLNPHYYELDDDAYKSLGFNDLGYTMNGLNQTDPFPKAPSWPYLAGLALLLGSLGYNIFSPKDYSNADAMIKAAKEAGNFTPVEFKPIGNYLTYRPDDPLFYTTPIMAESNATQRSINNKFSPSLGAETLANGYNTMLALGQATRQLLDNNFNKYAKVGEFNKDTDKFNSEGLLKADMANQDAATRARGFTLEGLKSGYAMRQAVDDAKANAINLGITGLANLAYNYAQNKYNLDLYGWGMRHDSWGPGVYYKEDAPSTKPATSTATFVGARGGKLKVRRKKGLGF